MASRSRRWGQRWQFGICLLLSLVATAWVAAEPAQPTWQVRELAQQSPARIRLIGGWFVLGSDQAELERAIALCKQAGGSDCSRAQFAAETPARRVFVRSFEIDRLEVSNAAYGRCVTAGRCFPPRGAEVTRPERPVVQVNWREAREYCRFMGGDLPSEAQWELAAHGDSQRSFPWGDMLSPELASYSAAAPSDVGAHAKGKSFFGVLNLAGNVWELVLDRYVAPYSTATHSVEPVQLEVGSDRVMRGGSFRSPLHTLRARARAPIAEDAAQSDLGFRCAYALQPGRAP
jgi:formylglycine-generating enzyme required for sulfatase activity